MQKIKSENGIVYYRSQLLKDVCHGFSTRIGGVSTLAHTSATNLAFGRGDDDATVIENLTLFCSALEIPPESVVSLPQVHSSKVITVTEDMRGEGYFKAPHTECDGYVTNIPGIALGIKIADCLPILLCDKEAGVVAALHAGWRGTMAGILNEGIAQMLTLSASPQNIKAAFGPSIGPCCFEVGAEVREAAELLIGKNEAAPFFRDSQNSEKYMCDLSGINKYLLLSAGIPEQNIDTTAPCTTCNSNTLFSHRKTQGKRGTMLAVVTL